jgi:hypothetical protein
MCHCAAANAVLTPLVLLCAGTQGTIVPGQCTPPSFTKGSLVPSWIEKKDCV